jgi:ABC-type phosphate/phosphonate transport system substrate-binding protein
MTIGIVSLPMYDWRELQPAHDAFWTRLASAFTAADIAAPKKLTRDGDDQSYWLHPNLLLGQTCGYPFSTSLQGKVRYVATPVYDVQGCAGGQYSSALVVRRGDPFNDHHLRAARFAYNSQASLSGYRAAKARFGLPETTFAGVVETGSHRNSARAVAEEKADMAALDAVCWHLLKMFEPETAGKLQVAGWTDPYPALPYITSLQTDDRTVAKIQEILVHFGPEEAIVLGGFEVLPGSDYQKLRSL